MVHVASLSPIWFNGYDVALELFFAVISLIVAGLAFRIYKKTSQRNISLFGISFLFIGVSYLIQSVINYLILSKLNENICRVIKIQSISAFNNFGLLVHILFMTIGLSVLVYLTCKQEKMRMLFLLILISVFGIFSSKNILYTFYLFSTVFLIIISWHFISNYLKNKKSKTLMIAIAFLFLLFGNFHFLVSVNHQLFYVLGHILELIAYILIVINYYAVLKK